jgi:hypothetical protein
MQRATRWDRLPLMLSALHFELVRNHLANVANGQKAARTIMTRVALLYC